MPDARAFVLVAPRSTHPPRSHLRQNHSHSPPDPVYGNENNIINASTHLLFIRNAT